MNFWQRLKDREAWRKRFTRKNALIGVGVLVVLFYVVNTHRALQQYAFLQQRDSSLIKELGHVRTAYTKFGEDLNEVRSFLRLPTESYLQIEDFESEGEADARDDLGVAVYRYLDNVAKDRILTQVTADKKLLLESLAGSKNFASYLEGVGMSISEVLDAPDGYYLKVLNGEDELVVFYLSKEDGELLWRTPLSKEALSSSDPQTFEQKTIELIEGNRLDWVRHLRSVDEKNAAIVAAFESEEVVAVTEKLSLRLGEEREKSLESSYEILNRSNNTVGLIVLDQKTLEVSLENADGDRRTISDMRELPGLLENLDHKDFVQKRVEQALEDVKQSLEDGEIKKSLERSGLKVRTAAREDDNRYYFDVFFGDDRVSSIVVEKSTGEVNVVDENGANSQNIFLFDPEDKKKTLDELESVQVEEEITQEDDELNILVAGKNGIMLDTMIFVHINETDRDIRMVSIPRDLHYNGRKINSFAFYYGMPELMTVLSEISGYQLDKYVLIDMYDFIEVVDAIGGVDLTLDQELVDPSYRVVDDGVEGTLAYAPGDYHFSGVEALRLARSRKTSSDFARAERQQLILEGLKQKAKNIGFGDADLIYELAKFILAKTDTNISFDEAIAYFFRYQSYELASNNVISSGNILYVPPYISKKECEAQIRAAQEAGVEAPGCENENHAYTLLPKNDDWNLIKKFFKKEFGDA